MLLIHPWVWIFENIKRLLSFKLNSTISCFILKVDFIGKNQTIKNTTVERIAQNANKPLQLGGCDDNCDNYSSVKKSIRSELSQLSRTLSNAVKKSHA